MTLIFSIFKKTFAVGCLSATLFSCGNNNSATTDKPAADAKDSITSENKSVTLKPAGAAPVWGQDIKPEMAVVIEKLASLGGKPIETLDAKEARMQPTPADAVKAVMADHNMTMPLPLCDTIGKDIPVTGGKTHIRIYTPKA